MGTNFDFPAPVYHAYHGPEFYRNIPQALENLHLLENNQHMGIGINSNSNILLPEYTIQKKGISLYDIQRNYYGGDPDFCCETGHRYYYTDDTGRKEGTRYANATTLLTCDPKFARISGCSETYIRHCNTLDTEHSTRMCYIGINQFFTQNQTDHIAQVSDSILEFCKAREQKPELCDLWITLNRNQMSRGQPNYFRDLTKATHIDTSLQPTIDQIYQYNTQQITLAQLDAQQYIRSDKSPCRDPAFVGSSAGDLLFSDWLMMQKCPIIKNDISINIIGQEAPKLEIVSKDIEYTRQTTFNSNYREFLRDHQEAEIPFSVKRINGYIFVLFLCFGLLAAFLIHPRVQQNKDQSIVKTFEKKIKI